MIGALSMKNPLILLLLTAFIVFGFIQIAFAEKQNEEEKIIRIEEMTVTGETNSIDDTIFYAPQSITIIDKDEIERKKPISIGDIIREIPGVEISQCQTAYRKEPVIRALGGHRVIIMVDGQQLSSNTFLSGTPLSTIDANSVERIEIIRGPTSVRYGSDALGGVINIITKKYMPSDTFSIHGKLGIDYASVYELSCMKMDIFGGDKKYDFKLGTSTTDAGRTQISDEAWPFVIDGDNRMYNTEYEHNDYSFHAGYRPQVNHYMSFNYIGHRGKDIGLAVTLEEDTMMPMLLDTIPDILGNILNMDPDLFAIPVPSWFINQIDNFIGTIKADSGTFGLPETGLDIFSVSYLLKNKVGRLASLEIKAGYQKMGWKFLHCPHMYLPFSNMDSPFLSDLLDMFGLNIDNSNFMDMRFQANHDSLSKTINLSGLSTWAFGDNHRVTTGIDFYHTDAGDNVSDNRQIKIFEMPVYKLLVYSESEVKQDRTRIFIEDEIVLGNFIITPGLNFDYLKAKKTGEKPDTVIADSLSLMISDMLKRDKRILNPEDNQWNGLGGALGIIYRLNPDVNLTATLARGIRLPSVDETYFSTPHSNNMIAGNWNLIPEKSIDYDIGIKVNFDRFFCTLNLYYTKIEDMIELACPAGFNLFMENTFQWENIKQVDIYGSEFSLRYFLTNELTLYSNAAYTKTKQEGGRQLAEPPPPFKGTCGMLYERQLAFPCLEGFNFELYSRFASHIKDLPPAYDAFSFNMSEVPGYFIYNMIIGITFNDIPILDRHRLILKVENITDKLYYEGMSGSPHGLRNFPQPGRSIFFSWTGEF